MTVIMTQQNLFIHKLFCVQKKVAKCLEWNEKTYKYDENEKVSLWWKIITFFFSCSCLVSHMDIKWNEREEKQFTTCWLRNIKSAIKLFSEKFIFEME